MSYSPPIAAALSGATLRQLAYWRRPAANGPALLSPSLGSKPRVFYSFEDVVALRMFVKLRQEVSLQRIRRAVAWMTQEHPQTHLSHHSLRAIGEEQTIIWISNDGDYFDVVKHPGDRGIHVVMESIFRAFETEGGRKVPDLAEPAPGLMIDPKVRGGYPVLKDTRIPFNVIAGLARDGLDKQQILMLYPRVDPAGIEGAGMFADLVEHAVGAHGAA